MNTSVIKNIDITINGPERYPVNPFDFYSDLLCCFSNQIIHMVIHLNGRIDPEILTRAAEQATLAEPVTRCRLVRDRDTLFWEMIPGLPGTDLIIRLSSTQPPDLFYQALSYSPDPYCGPMVQVVLIENEDRNGDILVINAHHAAMDGRGLKDFTSLIMSAYKSLITGDRIEMPPTPISQRQLPKVSTLVPEKIHDLSPDIAKSWLSKRSVPIRSLDAEKDQYSLLTLPADRTKILHTIRKEWGVTVNDLMIAAIARVCSSVIPEGSNPEIPLFTTIDLRRYLPEIPARSVLNYSTAFEVRVPVLQGASLKATALQVHHLMNQIKAGSPGLDGVIEAEQFYDEGYSASSAGMKNYWDQIREFGAKTTLFSNTGIISPTLIDPGEPGVSSAFLLPTHSLPPGFFFALSSYGEEMTLSATYYIPAYDPALIQKIFTRLDQIIPGFSLFPGIYLVI